MGVDKGGYGYVLLRNACDVRISIAWSSLMQTTNLNHTYTATSDWTYAHVAII